jgi:hypothetical protein
MAVLTINKIGTDDGSVREAPKVDLLSFRLEVIGHCHHILHNCYGSDIFESIFAHCIAFVPELAEFCIDFVNLRVKVVKVYFLSKVAARLESGIRNSSIPKLAFFYRSVEAVDTRL